MSQYVLYDTTTGTITSSGSCPQSVIDSWTTFPKGNALLSLPGDVNEHMVDLKTLTLIKKPARVPSNAELWADVRKQRNDWIAWSDWTHLPDAPLTVTQKALWATYRQALRDITKQADPSKITFPTPPI